MKNIIPFTNSAQIELI